MGGASLDRLGTGSATGSGRAPARLRERPGRLSLGRRRPADPARHSRSPPPSGFRPARLARAWRASACALAAALVLPLLLGAGAAQAHDEGAEGHVHLKLGLDRTSCPNCADAPTGTAEPGPGVGEITLRWEPATTGPQGNFVRWHIHAKKQSTGNVERPVRQITNAQTRSFTLTGLETGVTWTVGVEMRSRHNGVWAGDIAQARLEALSLSADAGDDLTVRAGARVALDGTGSRPARLTYAWSQTAGPTVMLDDASSATPAFIAPSVSMQTDLTFTLTVNDGTSSEEDTVTVTVLPSRVKSATVDGTKLSVTFDTALDTNSKPAGSAFTVTASKSGSIRTIAGTGALVGISDKTVTATLSAAVAADERLTVRYDKPASGNVLKDSSNNELPSFADRPAGNAGDTTPPSFVSASINGAKMTVVFNEALDESVLPPAAVASMFQIVRGNDFVNPIRSSGVSISGDTVTVTLATAVRHIGVRLRASYVGPQDLNSANALKDLAGNLVPQGTFANNLTNNTPPAYSSAKVNGSALTITFNGALDEDAVPAGSAFTVKATRSGTESTLSLAATNPVSISGSAVTLTLAEAVLRTDTVTVAYAVPATGAKLQDADNLKLPVTGFGDTKTATNDTAADTTGPTFVSASMNGTTLTVVFDETLAAAGASGNVSNNRFSVTHGGSAHDSTGVSISGATATATFAAADAPGHGESVGLLRYHQSNTAADRLADQSGNAIAVPDGLNFTLLAATATNVTPPAFSSATVDGDELTVTFDGALDGSAVPAGSAFTVKGTRSGTESTLSLAATNPVSVSGDEVTLTLAEAVLRIDTVTVAYAAPATGDKLQDSDNANHPVPDFSAQTATNDTPADTTPPSFVSASINGAKMTVVFNEALDESVLPPAAVASMFQIVRGNDFVNPIRSSGVSISGDTVTVTLATAVRHIGVRLRASYVGPQDLNSANALKDLAGNLVPQGTFANNLTNNTPPAYSSAKVNGSALTVTFDGALDEDAVPAGSAFTVKGTRSGTESTLSLAATNPVAVSGSEVTLTLAEAVLARRHGDGGLRGAGDGQQAAGLGQREAPGAGLLRPDGDQRHPGGHDGAFVRVGVGERDDDDGDLRRGAGRERVAR